MKPACDPGEERKEMSLAKKGLKGNPKKALQQLKSMHKGMAK